MQLCDGIPTVERRAMAVERGAVEQAPPNKIRRENHVSNPSRLMLENHTNHYTKILHIFIGIAFAHVEIVT